MKPITNRLMAHMIPWYPNRAASVAVAKGILSGGASYLEVQFPFTDPSADGPVIEHACQEAIRSGFKVDGGFAFVREIADWIDRTFAVAERPPIFIMSYASLVVTRGVQRFVDDAHAAGVAGLIIPDLPPESDEGLYQLGRERSLAVVPVVVPFISQGRLDMVLTAKPDYVYCALRAGITGSKTELSAELLAFLGRVRASGAKLLGGFGIHEPAQVAALAPQVHAVVVGSQLVRTIDAEWSRSPDLMAVQKAIETFVAQLANAT